MNQIQLFELVAKIGQAAVAEAFRISPAAVHKAVRSGRKIVVSIHDDGTYSAEEIRPFPHQRTADDISPSSSKSSGVLQPMGTTLV